MNWVVILSRRGSRDVRRLDTPTRRRVFAALNRLASGVATDVVRLADIPDTFRLRVGDWRIIFEYRQEVLAQSHGFQELLQQDLARGNDLVTHSGSE